MDSVTHTMLGVAMARAGLARRLGRGTTLVLVVASNLPDIDALWSFAGLGESHFSRRMVTHSLPGLLLLAAAAATVFHWLYHNHSWRTLFGLSLMAVSVHVLFDLLNSYGVVLLYPFSRTRFELAWVFIVDLVVLGLLLAPAVLGRWLRPRVDSSYLWRAALVGVAVYVGICGAARMRAEAVLRQIAAGQPTAVEMTYVFPEPLGPHRFRGVLKDPDSGYRAYLIRVWSGEAELAAEFPTDERHPAMLQARASDAGRKLEWFFRAPVWEWVDRPRSGADGGLRAEGYRLAAYDLRFQSLVLDRPNPFRYAFRWRGDAVEPLGWQ